MPLKSAQPRRPTRLALDVADGGAAEQPQDGGEDGASSAAGESGSAGERRRSGKTNPKKRGDGREERRSERPPAGARRVEIRSLAPGQQANANKRASQQRASSRDPARARGHFCLIHLFLHLCIFSLSLTCSCRAQPVVPPSTSRPLACRRPTPRRATAARRREGGAARGPRGPRTGARRPRAASGSDAGERRGTYGWGGGVVRGEPGSEGRSIKIGRAHV